GDTAFWAAVAAVRPDLTRAYQPWAAVVTPEGLLELYAAAGIDGARAELVVDEQPLGRPEDFWTIALGSGYRRTIDALGDADGTRVRDAVVAAMAGVRAVTTSAVHGSAVMRA